MYVSLFTPPSTDAQLLRNENLGAYARCHRPPFVFVPVPRPSSTLGPRRSARYVKERREQRADLAAAFRDGGVPARFLVMLT